MLLAFDLDKTLVTDDFVLPECIEQAIRSSRERGHLVTVLTGRPLAAARPYLEQLGITGPYSVNHGGQVMGAGGRELRRRRIAARHVDGLLEAHLKDGDVEFSCIVDDVLWVRDPDDDRWGWAHTRSRRVDRFRTGMALDADKLVFYSQQRSAELDREVAERHPDMLRYLWGDGFLASPW
ncbi:MAG: HAD hydrolase family protein [Deinococcales bacterium]